MKHSKTYTTAIIALTLAAGSALAQQSMGSAKATNMGSGQPMPMKDMPMGTSAQGQTHHATGTVKKIDAVEGMVTFAHGPVATLGWPAMTMGFKVKDKALIDRLAVGKQVEFDFTKEGAGFIVTAVR